MFSVKAFVIFKQSSSYTKHKCINCQTEKNEKIYPRFIVLKQISICLLFYVSNKFDSISTSISTPKYYANKTNKMCSWQGTNEKKSVLCVCLMKSRLKNEPHIYMILTLSICSIWITFMSLLVIHSQYVFHNVMLSCWIQSICSKLFYRLTTKS